jgi:tetratricopeptide (TPR) repeat protein
MKRVKGENRKTQWARKAISAERGSGVAGGQRISERSNQMVGNGFSKRIADFFQEENWAEARALLKRELEKEPENHWLLTQLGVTYYEQQQYKAALKIFLESYKILDDCPLTLWNLAGTFDALGESKKAIAIYTWLLESAKSPADDPCWESKAWTDRLKTDCVFRLGVCFQKQGKRSVALDCFRQYLNLLSIGIDGMYTAEDALKRIHGLSDLHQEAGAAERIDEALRFALQRVEGGKGKRGSPNLSFLKVGRRAKRAVGSAR